MILTIINYQGSCLCCSLTKLYEWIWTKRYSKNRSTSHLQFKSDHTTAFCCLTMKEVVKYYHNRGSDMNGEDASKASNIVCHDKLFQLLKH